MTLIEQLLGKLWLRSECMSDWWDLQQQLTDMRDAFIAEGMMATAELFNDAREIALMRCVYDIQFREAA